MSDETNFRSCYNKDQNYYRYLLQFASKEQSLNYRLEYLCKVPWKSVFEKLVILIGCPNDSLSVCCCRRVRIPLKYHTLLFYFLLFFFHYIYSFFNLPRLPVRDPFKCQSSLGKSHTFHLPLPCTKFFFL